MKRKQLLFAFMLFTAGLFAQQKPNLALSAAVVPVPQTSGHNVVLTWSPGATTSCTSNCIYMQKFLVFRSTANGTLGTQIGTVPYCSQSACGTYTDMSVASGTYYYALETQASANQDGTGTLTQSTPSNQVGIPVSNVMGSVQINIQP